MLVNNETGHRPAARRGRRARPGARARHAVLHTDAVQAPQWLDLRVAHRGRRPRRDLRAQVRRPEGRRRARRARRRRRSCRSSKAAATSGARGRAPRTSPAIVALADGARRSPTRQRAEEIARIAALRDRLAARARASPSPVSTSTATRTRRVAGHPPRRVPRRRSRDAARRARPARRLRGVGFGVQLGRDRPVARAPRDGHRPRTARCRGPLQPRLRVDRRRRRRRARASIPERRRDSLRRRQ